MYTDLRAQRIHEAAQRIDELHRALKEASADRFADLMAELRDAIAEKEAALALPQHQYQCPNCVDGEGNHQTFESPARMVLTVIGVIDHDEEGNVITDVRFREPRYLTLCPDCKAMMRPLNYLDARWKESK